MKSSIIKIFFGIIVLFNGISLFGSSINNETLSVYSLVLFGASSMILGAQIKSLKI